ncbi:MAG: histidine--tRNA ligase [Elusimicrobia bacterium CG03_land_8_20_14_0_80_50_18]|nr:MAG: histidine--tRNA ligase [Elusimicrobia bacterium CG03_land_8_20_14_0_80_50_18]PIX14364.1 MAG: histidine--tRNA ligase [Elusimicrobia bacterium CG_4_8_14_3_um_filter_50_9]
MKTYNAPKGTRDIAGEEAARFSRVSRIFEESARLYGYGLINTPIFEDTALFERTIGGASDIVQKQMYTFLDKADRSLTLRPEGTAPVARAAIAGGLLRPLPCRLYYSGAMFRYEKPQKDRKRQFFQVGAEYFGDKSAFADLEVISLCSTVLKKLGLDCELKLNSIGCSKCRSGYEKKLTAFAEKKIDGLCDDCGERLRVNPLRILDCKVESCKKILAEAPDVSEALCPECADNFGQIKQGLRDRKIRFNEDVKLVRGLDYYNGCVFEFYAQGARDAVAAGGRYDGLVKLLGGEDVPAAGFAIGVDRVMPLIDFSADKPDYMLVSAGAPMDALAAFADEIRDAGKVCVISSKPKLKNALKEASAASFRFALIMGEDEIKNMTVSVRDMEKGEQKTLSRKEFLERL